MTLAIARRFDPAHILGVELDERLVHAAKQNIRHFLSHDLVVEERMRKKGGRPGPSSSSPPRKREGGGGEEEEEKKTELIDVEEEKREQDVEDVMQEFQQALCLFSLPLSFRVSRGPLAAPPLFPPSSSSSSFPNNVTFIQVSGPPVLSSAL